jgi:hypothetical protein
MIDITTTSFGLLIAYLLPGLAMLFGMSYWIPELRTLFNAFLTGESNIGLFLLVALASIVTSLQITLVRWYIFEVHLCRNHRLNPKDFDRLGRSGKVNAFGAAVDAHYRYHQFWGSMTVALPVLFAGWAEQHSIFSIPWQGFLFSILFLALEALTAVGAFRAFVNYIDRARHIMKGG